MGNVVQYSVNIAMESTILLVIVILLVTFFWQKRLFTTTIPLILLSSFDILLLINQIVTWSLLICDAPVKYGAIPMRIVFILDYVLYAGLSISFYYYVEALVKYGYSHSGDKYRSNKNTLVILLAWGILSSWVYAVLVFVPSIYWVQDGETFYNVPAYVLMHIMAGLGVLYAMLYALRHRKVLGKHDTTLCVGFTVLVSLFIIVDELFGLCISYVLVSLFAFVLYIRIDLRKGLLVERKEKEIIEWKTQIMLSQMQPHFLYNVLTTISSMCELQNAMQARDVVNRFADYLRMNLDSLGKEKTIPFEKELEHVKTYLWLEKIRFEDELNICYDIGPSDFMVPSLAVQPIAENAVKHGILQKEEGGTITIKTYETNDDYVISIEDDGVGFDVGKKQNDDRAHVGIENVSKRLEIICKGTLDIQSEIGKGTVVTMHIPKGVTI